jgi:hypothetical protein
MDRDLNRRLNDKRNREQTATMLGLVDTVAGAGLVGLVPGGLFELLLPIWLFVRGFNLTASDRMRVAAVSD